MPRLRTRSLTIAGVIVLTCAAAVTLVGLNAAVGASPAPPRDDLETVSNAGAAVTASGKMQAVLERTGTAGGVVRKQARVGGKAFYQLNQTPRGTCYGIGLETGAQADLNQLECGTDFPSTEQPILDASVVEEVQATGAKRVIEVQGWAADGVSSVAVLDASERVVAEARVSKNVYAIDEASLRGAVGVQVVARDNSGSVVYTQVYE